MNLPFLLIPILTPLNLISNPLGRLIRLWFIFYSGRAKELESGIMGNRSINLMTLGVIGCLGPTLIPYQKWLGSCTKGLS